MGYIFRQRMKEYAAVIKGSVLSNTAVFADLQDFVFVLLVFCHNVHNIMYFLLSPVRAIIAFELGFFTTLPSTVVVKRALAFVGLSAAFALKGLHI